MEPFDDPAGLRRRAWSMSSKARYSSYSRCSGLPQYSVPRSVSTCSSRMPALSKNGATRSLSRSAAGKGALRSWSVANATFESVSTKLIENRYHAHNSVSTAASHAPQLNQARSQKITID